jgi:hypothetical protein
MAGAVAAVDVEASVEDAAGLLPPRPKRLGALVLVDAAPDDATGFWPKSEVAGVLDDAAAELSAGLAAPAPEKRDDAVVPGVAPAVVVEATDAAGAEDVAESASFPKENPEAPAPAPPSVAGFENKPLPGAALVPGVPWFPPAPWGFANRFVVA